MLILQTISLPLEIILLTRDKQKIQMYTTINYFTSSNTRIPRNGITISGEYQVQSK